MAFRGLDYSLALAVFLDPPLQGFRGLELLVGLVPRGTGVSEECVGILIQFLFTSFVATTCGSGHKVWVWFKAGVGGLPGGLEALNPTP